jgi:tetratricopeptide (TPR) repeat protein
MQRLGRPQEADAAYRRSLTLQERLSEEFPDRLEYREKLARDYFALAVFLRQTGRPEGAAPLFRRARDVTARLAADSPSDLEQRGRLANCSHALGDVLRETGQPGEAEAAYREAIEIQERLLADLAGRTGAPSVSGLRSSDIRHYLGGNFNNLALVLIDRGELNKARLTLEQALAHQRAAIDADPMNQQHRRFLLEHYTAIGTVLIRLGEYAKAAEDAEEQVRALPDSGLAAARAASCLIRCAAMAEEDVEQTPGERRETARSMTERARVLALEADRLSTKDADALNELARLYADAPNPQFRDPARAVALAKAAVAVKPLEAEFRTTLGLAHYRMGDWKAAVAALEGPGGIETDGLGKFLLAMAQWQRGEKDEARKWFDRAVAWVEKNQPRDDELRRFRAEAATLLGRAAGTTP